MDTNLTDEQLRDIATTLESYVLRRAICNLTAKNYNRTFLTITRYLRKEGTTPAHLTKYLASLTGDSNAWPTDQEFSTAWQTAHAYSLLHNPRMIYVLRRLNQTFTSTKHESITIDGPLTVEHLMPQHWEAHWPLPDGSKPLDWLTLMDAPPDDPVANLQRARARAVQTFGNLTILTQPLNSSISNSAWNVRVRTVEVRRPSLGDSNKATARSVCNYSRNKSAQFVFAAWSHQKVLKITSHVCRRVNREGLFWLGLRCDEQRDSSVTHSLPHSVQVLVAARLPIQSRHTGKRKQ